MTPQTESKSILDNPTVLERAIIYARVSTDEQAESGTSIDNQIDKSLAYAAAHNLQVVNIFREDYTGKVLDRPELSKVRELLRAGLADNLIVYKTNRLDRSEWGLNLLILLQEFKQLGVSLHYSQSGRRVDLTNPVEALMQSIEGWQAGEDHRETVSKLHEGRIRRAHDGYVVPHGGNAPFGYRPVKIEKKWYFEIYEPEAQIIRMIFQWYVMGDETGKNLSMHAIANRLNQLGLLTRRGRAWTGPVIQPILADEVYCGTWYYRKSATKNDPSIQPIPVSVPAIISREMWEQAKKQLVHNVAFAERNRKPGRYLLSSRVTCGECKYAMVGTCKQDTHGNDRYKYYVCENAWPTKKRFCECHQPSFRVGDVDGKIWDKLEEVSRDKQQLIDGLRGYQAQQESKVEPIRRELAHVEELIKDKTAEWESAYLDQKVLTSKMAKARKALEIDQLEQVIEGLQTRKADLLADLQEKSLTEEQIIGTVAFAFQVAEDMDKLRALEIQGKDNPELKIAVYEAKRRLLAILDVQVTLFVEDGRKKARMTAKYCPKGLTVELDNICNSLLNRENWLLFECVIDLD